MIEIIPAIDLIGGKCVRLTEGDYKSIKIYDSNPVETAELFQGAGLRRLHLVDLDGAKIGKSVNLSVLERIANAAPDLAIDYSGGLKKDEDVTAAFEAGAAMVSIGSVAVADPAKFEQWLEGYGSEKVILSADVRNGNISIDGWQNDTEVEAIDFLKKWSQKGVIRTIVTDISKDGRLEGSGTDLYRAILAELPELRLIASGGVSSVADVNELNELGCSGVIIGKALYEGQIKLKDLNRYVG
jgi:phosphoribosylformimino-5-aminoimidazole carboxamide ribotide isomerase